MNQKEWESAHYKRIQKYVRQIRDIFNKAAEEAAKIGVQINQADLFSDQLFKFENFPKTQEAINQLMSQMHEAIQTVVTTAISKEWQQSNSENDSIAQRVLGINSPEEASEKFQKYFNKNIAAQEAFINRKESGLNLSERVWKYVGGFKSEIEAGLDVGIRDGLSAAEMARDLKKYLQEPERLYRRVRDKHGNLVLSKAARAYNPGRGVYRSSYKNALRLTRTETNMAYRAADHERQKQLDFVVGIEVRLTNNPGHIYDICDELKGQYPKDFKFVGWHPNCMCHAVTILKTPEELAEDIDKINRGEKTDTHSQNEVTDLPQNFKDWAVENQDRIASAKNQPYFIRDNFKGTDVNKWFTSTSSDQPEKQTPAPLTIPKPAASDNAINQLYQVMTDEEKKKLEDLEKKIPETANLVEKLESDKYMKSLADYNFEKVQLFEKYADRVNIKLRDTDLTEKEFKQNLKNSVVSLNQEEIHDESRLKSIKEKTGISDVELAHIQKYTRNVYRDLNGQLRSGNPDKIYKDYANTMDYALSRMPKFEGTVMRGINPDPNLIDTLIKCNKTGSEFSDAGFLSTSYNRPFKGRLRFLIEVKNGAVVDNVSVYGRREAEVLMRTNTKFKVLNILEDNGNYYVHMKEL